MLTRHSFDDIEYSNSAHSTPKKRIKRRAHSHRNLQKVSKKFIHRSNKCAVCLDDTTCLDTKLFPCGHSFHGKCLIQWVSIQNRKFNCPLCRQDIAHFVQMTGNQEINEELIQIWNEHYVCNDTLDDEIIDNEYSECTLQSQDKERDSIVCTKSEDCSIWKYIWRSALSLYQTAAMHSKVIMLNQTIYSLYSYDIIMTNNALNRSMINSKPNLNLFSNYRFKSNDDNDDDDSMEQLQTQTIDAMVQSEDESFLKFSSLNFKSGILAGVSAGTTTYLIAQKLLNKGVFRRSFYPILSESVPNIAIFFTSYEHLKKYIFDVDNMNKGWYHTFSERFMSAGIASSVACLIQSGEIGGKGLLPLRYAAFFGTFELCKDIINKNHENLNSLSVACSAGIGGVVSHGLYYPLFEYKNRVHLTSFNGVIEATKGVFCQNMYRGFVSSLSKFLPSCIVCSCAFEYSKRYLNT